MKRDNIFRLILLMLLGMVMSGALVSCYTTSSDRDYGNLNDLRPGEDPGQGLYTNYQTVGLSNNSWITVKGTVLATVNDPDGDDYERGWMTYPNAYPAGSLDVHQVIISADTTNIYFYICFQDRIYRTVASASSTPGFSWVYMGIWFGTNSGSLNPLSAKGTGTNFTVYSPGETTGSRNQDLNFMSHKLYTTNVQLVYGMGVLGSASPVFGTLWHQSDAVTAGSGKELVKLTMASNHFLTTNGYVFPDVSTVMAFVVPRVGELTNSGADWKITMMAYGWEDYGFQNAYPGNNGYPRSITGYSSEYTPGVGGSANLDQSRKCMDFVIGTTNEQISIMQSGIVADSDMISVTLP